ncbi:MAG: amidohydrolase [Candidatus Eremiobacteraeota bacterium]|nr:amidohydrolase [Candidatus Eremiobacteraeota bacterium]
MKRSTFFAGLSAAGLAACSRGRLAPDRDRATLVIRGGSIYTARADGATAEAMAVAGDRILAAGSRATIDGYIGPATRTIDLGGGMALPGFIDTHTHFVWGSIARTQVQLGDATSPQDAQQRLAQYARTHPRERWVLGGGWVYSTFPAGLPTRALIDAVISDRPAVLDSFDGHLKWLNSKALAIAGITRTTPDIVKNGKVVGTIVRDPATGEPTGILRDVAQNLILPFEPTPTREQLLSMLHDGMVAANAYGVTSVVNASGDLNEMDLYDTLRLRRKLSLRTTNAYSDLNGKPHTLTPAELDDFEEARRRYRDDWVRAGIVKFFMDGVVEGHTASLLDPYSTPPRDRGEADYPSGRYDQMLVELDRRGFAVMTHAIGDGAVREALNGYEAAMRANGPRDRRWRIEHIEVCDPADVPRFGRLGIIASMQPYHWCCHDYRGDDAWARNVGRRRWPEGFQWRNIARGGATMIHGSDWPVVTIDPLVGIYSAMTRQDLDGKPAGGWFPDQRLTLAEAIAGYTRNAAYAIFSEDRLGTLEPGKKADITVLGHDLRRGSPRDVLAAQIKATIVDGKVIYEGGAASRAETLQLQMAGGTVPAGSCACRRFARPVV